MTSKTIIRLNQETFLVSSISNEVNINECSSFVSCKMLDVPKIVITCPSETEDNLSDMENHLLDKNNKGILEEDGTISVNSKDNATDCQSTEDMVSDDDIIVICRSSTPSSPNLFKDIFVENSLEQVSSCKLMPLLPGKNDEKTIENFTGSEILSNVLYSSVHEFDKTLQQEGCKYTHSFKLHYATVSTKLNPLTPPFSMSCSSVSYVSANDATAPTQYQNGYNSSIANLLSTTDFAHKNTSSHNCDQENVRFENSVGVDSIRKSESYDNSGSQNVRESYDFVYPSIYVSREGLISVLLRHDMSVEMTVDRTIRVVSHHHMMAVAINSRGTSACIYHPALKLVQQGTTTDIDSNGFRVHMTHDDGIFAIGENKYKFNSNCVQPTSVDKLSDISSDQSVNVLLSSEGYGENLVPHSLEVAAEAEYANLPKGGVIIRINGIKVTQTGNGDVTVVTGAKFIRLSPLFGMTRLGNRFIDIEIERDWSIRVCRGHHYFYTIDRHAVISNSKLEINVNENGRFQVSKLHRKFTTSHPPFLHLSDKFRRHANSVIFTPASRSAAARPRQLSRSNDQLDALQ